MMTNCPVCGKLTCIHWPEHLVYRRGSTYYCGEQCLTDDLVRDTKLMNEVKKRRKREKKMLTKITPEMRKKAAEIAISGESPLEYLKKCGSKNPSASWQYIRQTLEKNDPETFAKLPDRLPKTAGDAMVAMKEAADNFFSQCEDMGLKMEPPTVKVDGPLNIETDKPEEINIHLTHEGAKIIGKVIAKNEKPIGFLPEEAIKNSQSFTAMVNGDPKTAGPVKRMKRYSVTAIRYPEIGEFYYDQKFNQIDWRTAEGDEVSMSPTGWKLLLQDLPEIFETLGVKL
ncbi:MAG: hypothetical protein IKG51_03720 [Firmicutes bacterium]|nr:hypothetical protein [Bacillota bacterium]